MLRSGTNLSFFRDSIKPTWCAVPLTHFAAPVAHPARQRREDSANKRGGRIMILPKAGAFEDTFYDCLWILAGSSLELAIADSGAWGEGHVVGMVASCRRIKQERIDMWISGPTPDREPSASYIYALKDALATELRSPEVCERLTRSGASLH